MARPGAKHPRRHGGTWIKETKALDIKTIKRDGELLLTLSGEINQLGAEKLKKSLGGLDLTGVRKVTVDFKQVTYIGSAGVGKLLLLYKNLPSPDATMTLVGLSPDIMHLFREMELDAIFTLSQSA